MKTIALALLFLCGGIGVANAKILFLGGVVNTPVVASIALTDSKCSSSQCGFTPSATTTVATAVPTMASGSFGAGTYALVTTGTVNGVACASTTGVSINSGTGVISNTSSTPGGSIPLCVSATPVGGSAYIQGFTAYSGWFVATGGSDSNAGSIAAPFATPAKCQTSMQGSGTNKACYVRSGTYAQTITLTSSDNGEAVNEYPPDGTNTAIFTGMNTTATAGFLVNSGTASVSGLIGACGTQGTVTTVNASGLTDGTDQTNLINALNSAGSGNTVRLSAGTYTWSRALKPEMDFPNGVWLVGTGTAGTPGNPTSIVNYTVGTNATAGTYPSYIVLNQANNVICGIKFNVTDQSQQNFDLSGQPNHTILILSPSTGSGPLAITRNRFVNCDQCVKIYQADGENGIYVQGNDFNGGTGTAFNLGQAITDENPTGGSGQNNYITDNTFEDIYRYAVETENGGSSGPLSNFHVDRNVVTNWSDNQLHGAAGGSAFSLVYSMATGPCVNNTVIGNTLQNNWSPVKTLNAIESGGAVCPPSGAAGYTTISNNTITSVCQGINLDAGGYAAWTGNSFSISTTFQTYCNNAWGSGGSVGGGGSNSGFNYIGSNTVALSPGTTFNTGTGCFDSVCSANFNNASLPTLYPASQQFF